MKRYLGLVLMGLSALATAENLPFYYSGKVTGELVNSVFTRELFDLTPGTAKDCLVKDVPPLLTSYRCRIADASANVYQPGGKSMPISLTELVAYDKRHKGGRFREHHYRGTSAEGPVKLLLWHYFATPKTIKGYLKFENLGLQIPVVATQP